MKYRPHNYQQYAKDFILEHPVCCLMLDMGLGKTVITLSALWELVLDRFDIGKILVIAPKRVATDTWPKELQKWEHLTGLTASLVWEVRNNGKTHLPVRRLYISSTERMLAGWCRTIGGILTPW